MDHIIQKFVLYGCIGILIEFFFTSVKSLIKRQWALTGQSYGWMFPIYSATALALETLSQYLVGPFWVKAFAYVGIIYLTEATTGMVIKLITKLLQKWLGGTGGGVIIWDYGRSRWSPLGLIQLKYFGLWYVLALCFEPISVYLRKIIVALTMVQ